MDDKDKDMLIKLYEVTFNDEALHIQYEQKTLSIYISLILAIVGGVLIVLKDIKDEYLQVMTLIIGGFLIILFCYIATRSFKSNYRRHLEAIAFRSKIEHLLDFDKDKFKSNSCWSEENLMMKRYLEDRRKYKNSEEFVQDRLNKGMAPVVRSVFISLGFLGSSLVMIGFYKIIIK